MLLSFKAVDSWRAAESKPESVRKMELWTALNAAIHGVTHREFEEQVRGMERHIGKSLNLICEFKFCGDQGNFPLVEERLLGVSRLFESVHERFPSFLRPVFFPNLAKDLLDQAVRTMECIYAWLSTFFLLRFIDQTRDNDRESSLSLTLDRFILVNGVYQLIMSPFLKSRRKILEKTVETCGDYTESWGELGLPSLANYARDLCMAHLSTFSHQLSIVYRRLGDHNMPVSADQVCQSWHALAAYAECYGFIVSLFGYPNVPDKYSELCSTATNRLLDMVHRWAIPENPENIDILLTKAPFGRPQEQILRRLSNIPHIMRLIYARFSVVLGDVITMIGIYFKHQVDTFLEEYSSGHDRGCAIFQLEEVVKKLKRSLLLFINTRHDLSRVVDNCIRCRLNPGIIPPMYNYYKTHGYIRVILEDLNDPDFLIFCKREVFDDREVFRILLEGYTFEPTKIDAAHVSLFHSEPGYPIWDGPTETIRGARETPIIFPERFERGYLNSLALNSLSANYLYSYFPSLKTSPNIEYPSRPADKEIARIICALDMKTLDTCVIMMDGCHSMFESGFFAEHQSIAISFLIWTNCLNQAFMTVQRVSGQPELRGAGDRFYAEFFGFSNTISCPQRRASFTFIAHQHLLFARNHVENNRQNIDDYHYLLRVIDEHLCRRESCSPFVHTERTEFLDWDEALELFKTRGLKRPQVGKAIEAQTMPKVCRVAMVRNIHAPKFKWHRLSLIGSGAFGTVYEILNMDSGMIMAMKEMKDTDSGRDLFVRVMAEFEIIHRISHPNILKYFAVERRDGNIFLFMEYCGTGSLLRLLTLGPVTDIVLLRSICLQILEGLACLHSHNIIHRDLKPDNVMLNGADCVKLVDFGTFLDLDAPVPASPPRKWFDPDELAGTPAYMAPEVIRGDAPSTKSDIWSFGCTVLHLATGRRPWYNMDNDWTIMYALGDQKLLPPIPGDCTIHPWVRKIILKCLVHDHRERPTASDLLRGEIFQYTL